MLTDKPSDAMAAEEHNIVPEEPTNGRVPVLQVELRHIHDALQEQTAIFREHCRQDEATRTALALVQQRQETNTAQIGILVHALEAKASASDVDEIKRSLRNPWVVAGVSSLSSSGILLGVLKALGILT